MPNPSWNSWAPGFVGILPAKFPIGSAIQPVDMRVHFDPEIGTSIVTSPVTKEPKVHPIPRWILREFQFDKLLEFYETQLFGGAIPFDWTNPGGFAAVKTFQFAKGGKPQVVDVNVPTAPVSGTLAGEPANQRMFVVSCALLELPWYP